MRDAFSKLRDLTMGARERKRHRENVIVCLFWLAGLALEEAYFTHCTLIRPITSLRLLVLPHRDCHDADVNGESC